MDKALKISLAVIIALLIGILLYNIFGINRNLKQAMDNVKESVKKIDSAQVQIKASQNQIKNLGQKVDSFKTAKAKIDQSVANLDQSRKQNQTTFNSKVAVSNSKLDSLKRAEKKNIIKVPSYIPLDTL